MKPWKYPKIIETGRKTRSDGSRTNRPTSLMTLEKVIKEICRKRATHWWSGDQVSVALRVKKMIRGSKITEREVKVAIWRAYVDQGCCLLRS